MRSWEMLKRERGLAGLVCLMGLIGLTATGCSDGVGDVGRLSASAHLGDCVNVTCEQVPEPEASQPVEEHRCEVSGSSELATEWSVSRSEPVDCELGECQTTLTDVAVAHDGSVWSISSLMPSDSNAAGVYLEHYGPTGNELSAKTVLFEIAERNALYLWFLPRLAVNSKGDVFASITRRGADGPTTEILPVHGDGSLGEPLVKVVGDANFGFDDEDHAYLMGHEGVVKLDSSFELLWSWAAPNLEPSEAAFGVDGSFAFSGVRRGRTGSSDVEVIVGFDPDAKPAFSVEEEHMDAALGGQRLMFTNDLDLLQGAYLYESEERPPEAYLLARFDSKGGLLNRQHIGFGEESFARKYDSAPLEHAGAIYIPAGVAAEPKGPEGLLRVVGTERCELLLFNDASLEASEVVVGPDGTVMVLGESTFAKVVLPATGK